MAANAQGFGITLNYLVEAAHNMNLTRTSPADAKTYLDGMLRVNGSPYVTAFVDANKVLDTLRNSGITNAGVESFYQSYGLNTDVVDFAAQRGGDIAIDTTALATMSVNHSDVFSALMGDVKAESGGTRYADTGQTLNIVADETIRSTQAMFDMLGEQIQTINENEEVFVSGEAIRTLFQKVEENMPEDIQFDPDRLNDIAGQLGVAADALANAITTGEDIAVNIGQFMNDSMTQEVLGAIQNAVSSEEGGAALSEIIQQVSRQSRETKDEFQVRAEELRLITQENMTKMVSVGIPENEASANANLMAAYFDNMSRIAGISPAEYARMYGDIDFRYGDVDGKGAALTMGHPLREGIDLDREIPLIFGQQHFQDKALWQIREENVFTDDMKNQILAAFEAGVTNKDTGFTWKLSNKNLGHVLHTAGNIANASSKEHNVLYNAALHLPELAENAAWVEDHDDKKPKGSVRRSGLDKVYIFLVPFTDDGGETISVLKIVGKKYRGNEFMPNEISLYDQYRVKTMETKKENLNDSSSSLPDQPSQAVLSEGHATLVVPGSTISVRDLVKGVKGSDGKTYFQSVYHGSAARFDGFDLNYVGTGEGNQVFGWGIYTTETEGIAKQYRRDDVKRKGMQYSPYLVALEDSGDTMPLDQLKSYLYEGIDNEDNKAAYELIEFMERERAADHDSVNDFFIKTLVRFAGEHPEYAIETIESAADYIESSVRIERPGAVYQIEIPDDTGQYLLWDVPYAEQSEQVKTALKNLAGKYEDFKNAGVTDGYLGDGERIYKELSFSLGSDKAASQALLAEGIIGNKYLDGASRASGEGRYNYVMFDENLLEITDTRYQQEGEQYRGAFQAFADGKVRITISPDANVSTAIHEISHFFFYDMRRLNDWLNEQGRPDAQLAADIESFRKWLGITDEQETLTEQQEEILADGFLSYLAEGKAPTRELQSVFQRFKKWLTGLYNAMAANNMELSDEVREVFDRMLAVEEEADALAEAYGWFDEAAAATEGSAVSNIISKRSDILHSLVMEDSKEKVLAFMIQDAVLRRRLIDSPEYRAEYNAAMKELRQSRLYTMISSMKENEAARINTQSLLDDFGTLEGIPAFAYSNNSENMTVEVADAFGYKSAPELIENLKRAVPIEDEAHARTMIRLNAGDDMRARVRQGLDNAMNTLDSLVPVLKMREDILAATTLTNEDWAALEREHEQIVANRENQFSRRNLGMAIRQAGGINFNLAAEGYGAEEAKAMRI